MRKPAMPPGTSSGYVSPARLTQSTARPGTRVIVAQSQSMYRGEAGTLVTPDARRTAVLSGFERRFLKDGAVLVEKDNGRLFVVPAHSLERA
jgi:hypothetical protein